MLKYKGHSNSLRVSQFPDIKERGLGVLLMSVTQTFAQGINDAIRQSMADDQSVICFGLGVPDPKGVFGTTLGLQNEFGVEQVFDTPTSENAMTGIGIGASLLGSKVLMTHQRLDFFLLAMDQLVNNAAKWHYMFGGAYSVPITIRLIMGRGWGRGPTHSQNLQSWFAHIPGLKVVMPSLPSMVRDQLYTAINDPNPIVFLEHRWLHNSAGKIEGSAKVIDISSSQVLKRGKDITLVSMSYLTLEALEAQEWLSKQGIHCELIDLQSVNPIDYEPIFESVKLTGRLLVLDTGFEACSVASQIISKVCESNLSSLQSPPAKLTMPNFPEPTSYGLTKNLYTPLTILLQK